MKIKKIKTQEKQLVKPYVIKTTQKKLSEFSQEKRKRKKHKKNTRNCLKNYLQTVLFNVRGQITKFHE